MIRVSRAVAALAVTLALVGQAARAWACPICAGRDEPYGVGFFFVYGLMMAMPFVVVYIGYRVIRRLSRTPVESDPGSRAASRRGVRGSPGGLA